ncbi:MAG: sensor histidine kinase [Gemmatimonadota bacterium]
MRRRVSTEGDLARPCTWHRTDLRYAARDVVVGAADRALRPRGAPLNHLIDAAAAAADRKRIRDLAARVLRVADEERAQIARELHDSCAQSLAALQMELSVVALETTDRVAAERLERVRRMAGDVLDEVRLLSHTVHPREMDDLGLGAALHHLVREVKRRGALYVDVDIDPMTADLAPAVAWVMYRVAREALTNIVRHAGAATIVLRAGISGDFARIEVRDDGVGFLPDDAERRRPGMGLSSMRERLALLEGDLEVDSALGRGTCVRARIPLMTNSRGVDPDDSRRT